MRCVVFSPLLLAGVGCSGDPVEPPKSHTYKVVGQLSDDDIQAIEMLVAKLGPEPIMSITVVQPNTVSVKTGIVRGPLDGGGCFYDFEKRGGKWVQIESSTHKEWVS